MSRCIDILYFYKLYLKKELINIYKNLANKTIYEFMSGEQTWCINTSRDSFYMKSSCAVDSWKTTFSLWELSSLHENNNNDARQNYFTTASVLLMQRGQWRKCRRQRRLLLTSSSSSLRIFPGDNRSLGLLLRSRFSLYFSLFSLFSRALTRAHILIYRLMLISRGSFVNVVNHRSRDERLARS